MMNQETRMKPSKIKLWLEAALAVCAGALGILTMFWPAWIEALTGWDPDHHNGSLEWLIVATLLALSAAMGLLANRHRRLLAAAAVVELPRGLKVGSDG
jgi:hypothetical protein